MREVCAMHARDVWRIRSIVRMAICTAEEPGTWSSVTRRYGDELYVPYKLCSSAVTVYPRATCAARGRAAVRLNEGARESRRP